MLYISFAYSAPNAAALTSGTSKKYGDIVSEKYESPNDYGFLAASCYMSDIEKNADFADLEENKELVFTGLLNRIYFYAQPGYGKSPKSDAIEETYLLTLHKPLILKDYDMETGAPYYRKTCFVHIGGNLIKRNMLGKNVTIKTNTKEVFGAITGHHRAPVLLTVLEIKEQER